MVCLSAVHSATQVFHRPHKPGFGPVGHASESEKKILGCGGWESQKIELDLLHMSLCVGHVAIQKYKNSKQKRIQVQYYTNYRITEKGGFKLVEYRNLKSVFS